MSIGAPQWWMPRDDQKTGRGRSRRPSLEILEDRCLLSTTFTQINLDSDVPGLARVTDPNLVNPWGISFSPTGAFWFGDAGTGVSDVVDGNGQLLPVVVAIPGSGGSSGIPTGTVYNGTSGFQITKNGVSGPAHFLFASEDGTISAWNPRVDDSNALVVIDNSQQGAVYKGLALATGTDGQPYLYSANFGQGKIDVFDQNFNPVSTSGSFSDPNLPSGFAPFNVQNINGQLFVTYAKKDTSGIDDVAGAGNGFIDVYSPSGNLVERLASGGPLNSPWGMTVAPQSFGSFSGALLVGNNGNGRINAYDLHNGTYLGQLTDSNGNPLKIYGLWGLTVGNDHLAGNSQTVFFAAGISWEQHGLFGAIQNSQGGSSGTAGTLPYDPNSNDDDYPLPPAQGPSLGGDSVLPVPSPVLLSVSNSSFALAPTLSISSEISQSQVSASVSPMLSAIQPGNTLSVANSVTVIGTITGPGTLSAFSLTSPLELTSLDQPTRGAYGFVSSNMSSDAFPLFLLLLDYGTPVNSAENPESILLPTSSDSDVLQAREDFLPGSSLSGSMGSVANEIPIKSTGEQIGALLGQERHSLMGPATPTEDDNSPDKPFYSRILHGLFLVAATCLPWNQYRVRESSGSNNLGQNGRRVGLRPQSMLDKCRSE